jgi:chaperonin GroEL
LNEKSRFLPFTRAGREAVRGGLKIAAGGVALLRAAKVLESVKFENADQRTGLEIVRRAIQTPARQIVGYAGADGSHHRRQDSRQVRLRVRL